MTDPNPDLLAACADVAERWSEQATSADLAAAVVRAERAEAVVRLLVETGGKCGSRRFSSSYCVGWPGHEPTHGNDFHCWTDGDSEVTPSPWTPDLMAALAEITEQGEADRGR